MSFSNSGTRAMAIFKAFFGVIERVELSSGLCMWA